MAKQNKQKNNWLGTEIIYLIFSLLIPFTMALVTFFACDKTFAEIFAVFDRYLFCTLVYFIVFSVFNVFLFYTRKDLFLRKSTAVLVGSGYLILFALTCSLICYTTVYFTPFILIGLLVSVLLDKKFAIFLYALTPTLFFMTFCCMPLSLQTGNILSVHMIQILTGEILLIFSDKIHTRNRFFLLTALLAVAISLPLSMIMDLLQKGVQNAVWRKVWIDATCSVLSMLVGLSAFMLLLPLAEFAFRLYSCFKLEEICSYDAPLMRRLASEAPGTYNHSIAMSILAQDCAEAIGEDPALAKAGACYHDIGKLKEPICFSENQTDYNPHDDFIPEVSISHIISHTKYGAKLIREKHLPEEIARIAEEHHGTQTVSFFLNRTRGFTENEIDRSKFSYRGPKPSTKISGIIMIVDTVEAATRAQGINSDKAQFRTFIHKLIAEKTDNGQFIECPLTLKDLTVIEDTLVRSIPGLYHQRIKYTK